MNLRYPLTPYSLAHERIDVLLAKCSEIRKFSIGTHEDVNKILEEAELLISLLEESIYGSSK